MQEKQAENGLDADGQGCDRRGWPRSSWRWRLAVGPPCRLPGRDQAILDDSHRPELLVTGLQQLLDRDVSQLAQVAQQVRLECVPHLARLAVRAAERLGNDVVDDA